MTETTTSTKTKNTTENYRNYRVISDKTSRQIIFKVDLWTILKIKSVNQELMKKSFQKCHFSVFQSETDYTVK